MMDFDRSLCLAQDENLSEHCMSEAPARYPSMALCAARCPCSERDYSSACKCLLLATCVSRTPWSNGCA